MNAAFNYISPQLIHIYTIFGEVKRCNQTPILCSYTLFRTYLVNNYTQPVIFIGFIEFLC